MARRMDGNLITALMIASVRGDADKVSLLIEYKANIETVNDRYLIVTLDQSQGRYPWVGDVFTN